MPTWNELFTEKNNRWEQPFETVTDLVNDKTLSSKSCILDLGCGAGRHLKYLNQNHIPVVGMDLSWNGLSYSKSLLMHDRYRADLTQADMSDPLPYKTGCFDGVISIHVIFHNPLAKLQLTLSEIWRVLKPGGFALITFNSIYSYRFGKGLELEPGTWVPDLGVDKGIPHHFSSFEDLAMLMKEFKVLQVKLLERTEKSQVSSHWVVTAQKPQ